MLQTSASSSALVTRFAPSPTGRLHIGHAFSALFSASVAPGGRFLLRIEDIDRGRCRPEFEAAILEDLGWLGLEWETPVRRQSEHMADYRRALDALDGWGLLYPCFCTRKDLRAEAAGSALAPHGPNGPDGPLYPGICRTLSPPERAARIAAGTPYALRLDMDAAAVLAGPLRFRDRSLGDIEVNPAGCGDVVLARKDVATSYHLAVTVDDAAQGVTLVTRGEDLLHATHVHRILQALLDLPEPEYWHHRLLRDASGRRYAKRDRDETIQQMRQSGMTPSEVREMAGFPPAQDFARRRIAGKNSAPMPYCHSIDTCLADAIGPTGLDAAALDAEVARTAPALDRLRAWRRDGGLPLLALPDARDDLAALAPLAARYRADFDDVIVLGTGGSSLGGRGLYALRDAGWGPPPGTPRLHFMDNVDPHSFDALFATLDPMRSGVLAISKSGGTAETLVQTLCCLAWLETGGAAPARHMTAITEAADNPMRRLAARRGVPILDHDPGLGGRYAALSLVGMLPALIAGLDAAAVRAGAAEVLESTLGAARPADSAPAVGAALSVALARTRGVSATVLMPYIDRLAPFALWVRQLWAESLGKDGQGTTLINAIGAVDQHSQLQLYLDGPNDKMFTILMGPGGGDALDADLGDADPALAYLAGRGLGDLLDACQHGTADALAAAGRPVRIIAVDAVNERVLGALMMHFMLETIIAADLFGVDPFDQPAVEDGKRRTRVYLDAMALT